MDVRLTPSLAFPGKCPVGEVYPDGNRRNSSRQSDANLFALRYRIRGNVADDNLAPSNVVGSLKVPSGYIIKTPLPFTPKIRSMSAFCSGVCNFFPTNGGLPRT